MTQVLVLGNAKLDPKCHWNLEWKVAGEENTCACLCGFWHWKHVFYFVRFFGVFFFFFGLLNIITGFFGPPQGKRQRVGYTHHGDINIFGIMLLCEVLASILLNMHECLKWILVATRAPSAPLPSPFFCPLLFIVKLYNHVPVYLNSDE